ncbi:hypothetical protein JOM56_006200 [Amanita muscaria]
MHTHPEPPPAVAPVEYQLPSRTQPLRNSPSDTSQSQTRRPHRSVEVRSNSRLSGFFNNLIHRRDPTPNPSTPNSARDDAAPSGSANRTPINVSRSPSPPPARAVTPPPTLPPPTLQELGLTLSEVTGDMSPSHFSNPPISGAFLAPHYLLLCHSQGLDVLPIVSPPAPQPYALIRRVSFKSVVVMEHRGVLVAIAGRRDGVRVYALEEIKKAIEWRIDVEVRRERERQRRETKKAAIANGDPFLPKVLGEKSRRASISTPPGPEPGIRTTAIPRKASTPLSLDQASILPLVPRPPVPRSPVRRPRTPHGQQPHIFGQPPPYDNAPSSSPGGQAASDTPTVVHSRGSSVSNVIGSALTRPSTSSGGRVIKTNWEDTSEDEAIDIVAAGTSGSQALDERTSATHAANAESTDPNLPSVISHTAPTTRRNRPANLDLSLARPDTTVPPSPAPTLLTIRQALTLSPAPNRNLSAADNSAPELVTPIADVDIDDEDGEHDGQLSLAQVLLESRLPNLPPVGTRRPQQPILISHSVVSGDEDHASPRASEVLSLSDGHQSISGHSHQARRRWSQLISTNPGRENGSDPTLNSSPSALPSRDSRLGRATSLRSFASRHSNFRPSTAPGEPSPSTTPPVDNSSLVRPSNPSRSTRFLSRILNTAFPPKRPEDQHNRINEVENSKKASSQPTANQPPPKLEYVKLPGTKGALLVKAVETPKKSFLAILCGEHGEKVELFAGTYRTALGLSRTFILPDSPKSLELQLQGDDLVEVFLVFSQNVFGLEPATVRVREVRIGRAERRAARRRARELRATETSNATEAEEEPNITVNVSVTVSEPAGHDATLIPTEHPDSQPEQRPPSPENGPTNSQTHADELLAVTTAQMGPYTTFQQLSFAPKFPLASIADEYIIPPTYPDFIEYRDLYEPDVDIDSSGTVETTQAQFSPPGLPVPPPAPPSKWYYRDPKGVVHGPWKASLMQNWYKEGFLPLDLPVRREEETTFTLLRDLRLQSVDPTEPFRSAPPPVTSLTPGVSRHSERHLLHPISLLAQPRHFGPPALFYSSRGGHSTAIVDGRGRSVLKGRFVWSNDGTSEDISGRMGDVKRIEAFDVNNRAVLVAMRQGGLEVVDLNDALLRPADESRTVLPLFNPPLGNINRRAPFVWKIGTRLTPVTTTSPSLSQVSLVTPKSSKKQTMGSAKSPAGRSEFSLGDLGSDYQEEVLFLGRKDDELYLCERSCASFRILRLCPQAA